MRDKVQQIKNSKYITIHVKDVDLGMWTGLIWLRIRTNSGLL
jgi:hypothetical protein